MKKVFTILVAVLLTATVQLNAQWTQIGSDIDGEAAGDYSGHSVSLSADGSIIAIGAVCNDGNGINAGHVRIYQNTSGTWSQVGTDIDGEATGDRSGWSIALSSDGSVVAIGAIDNAGSGYDAGHVRIYKNISGIWTQIGQDIDGEAANDASGWSVSLSSNGSVVAIGSYLNDGNGIDAGHVRIYKDSSGMWTQIGSDINGEAANDKSSYVSLNSDGSVVAIGSTGNDENGIDAGHVRIYENLSGTWTQIGSDINGEAANDFSGSSVSLSSNGDVIAIGAPGNDDSGFNAGHVRIYENIAGTWTQIGQDIDGETAGDNSGCSVSLSADGDVVAIGAPYNVASGISVGHVRIYKNIAGTWTQIGSDIDGEAADDYFGSTVSISSNGSIVSIGGEGNDKNGYGAGHVRIYTNPTIGINERNNNIKFSLYPNPTTGKITIECEKMERVEVLDITGKVLYEQLVSRDAADIDISAFSKGVYFVKVYSAEGVGVEQVVWE